MGALEQFPGIASITDYSEEYDHWKLYGVWPEKVDGLMVWMNEALLQAEALIDFDYYGRRKSEVLVEGYKYAEEDLKVLEAEHPVNFYNDSRYSKEWIKYKYMFKDGDRTYVVAVLVELSSNIIDQIMELKLGGR